MNSKNLLIVLLLGAYECLSERDKELINKLKTQELSIRRCFKNNLVPNEHYEIYLLVKDECESSCSKYLNSFSIPDNSGTFYIEIGNKEEIEGLINYFTEKKDIHYVITLKYKNENKKLLFKLREYTKFLQFRLDEANIYSVTCKYKYGSFNINLYNTSDLWNEIYKDNLFIIRTLDSHEIWRIKEIKKISDGYLKDLMNDYFNLYFDSLNDPRKEQLIRKYLFNHKLLLIDIDALREDEDDLRSEWEEESKIQNIVYFNVLFYFLKDSDTFKKIVRRSLNNCESDNYFIFKRILKDLEIDFVDGYEILFTNTKKILIPPIKIINEYLIEDICKKIKILKVKNNTKNYTNLLNYFYNYMKDIEEIEVDELLGIIKLLLTGDNLKEKNIVVFKKLNQYFSFLCSNEYHNFFYERYLTYYPVNFDLL